MAHEILRDYYLNGAVVYIDDTIIYGRNEEKFLTLLDQILSKLVEFNVIQVLLWYIPCCHVFSESGMQLSDERVQGIRQIPEPTSLKAVRSFVGKVVNNFCDSINGLSGHLIPLTA